jgi:HSP20 family protein
MAAREVSKMAKRSKSKAAAKPETKKARQLAVKKGTRALRSNGEHPLSSLRSEIERIFDEFAPLLSPLGRRALDTRPFRRFEAALGATVPPVNVVETDGKLSVTAELPGIEAKDVEVEVSKGVLTIKGDKEEFRDEKRGDYHVSERRFGSFQRSVALPADVDMKQSRARFDKGVLTVTLPKTSKGAKAAKSIRVEAGA